MIPRHLQYRTPLPHAPCRVRRKALLAVCAALSSAGCGGLLPKPAPAPARHTLDASETPAAPGLPRAGAPVLVVDIPRAAPGYDTRHMVYQRRPQELEAFAFHEWVEPPSRMLAPLLVRALQQGGAFRAVLLAPSAAAGSWRLETELIRLQQDFITRPSQLRLSLRAVLVDGRTRQVIAWREFDARVAVASDDPVAGVQAAQGAVQQVLVAVAAFSADAVQHAAPSPP